MTKILIGLIVLLLVALLLCLTRPWPCPSKSAEPQDRPDILRRGAQTDIHSAFWESSFSEIGPDRTFARFAVRFEEIAREDAVEAKHALAGFRRFCRLNRCLETFDAFWDHRTSPKEMAAAPPGEASTVSLEAATADEPEPETDLETGEPAPETSTKIDTRTEADPTVDGWTETLYQATSGKFFIFVQSAKASAYTGATFGEWITDEAAIDWLRQYSSPEKLAQFFPGR